MTPMIHTHQSSYIKHTSMLNLTMDLFQNDVKRMVAIVWRLHGRPMERLVFRYDRHEEITRYILQDIFG